MKIPCVPRARRRSRHLCGRHPSSHQTPWHRWISVAMDRACDEAKAPLTHGRREQPRRDVVRCPVYIGRCAPPSLFRDKNRKPQVNLSQSGRRNKRSGPPTCSDAGPRPLPGRAPASRCGQAQAWLTHANLSQTALTAGHIQARGSQTPAPTAWPAAPAAATGLS
eukprot:SAG25_NODE_347_length_9358_cov_86.358315_5_plen_165_part_00